jgi:hypothetical protein
MINKLRRDVIVVFILLFVELLIITVKFKRSFHNYSTDFLISYNNIMNGCMRVYVHFDILLFRSYLTFYGRIITYYHQEHRYITHASAHRQNIYV